MEARYITGTDKNLTDFMENTIFDPWTANVKHRKVRMITKNTKKVWAKIQKSERMNVLGMITCSVAFGIALSRLGPEGRPLQELFEIFMKIVMSLINAVMWYGTYNSLLPYTQLPRGDSHSNTYFCINTFI